MSKKKNYKKDIIFVGQTLESNDLYLPYPKNKVPKSKIRPVIVADKKINLYGIEEYLVIPGSTQDTANTVYYNKHGIKYYRKNIEVCDNEGKPIVKGKKFRLTNNCSKMPKQDVKVMFENNLNHSRFSSENRKKFELFKNRYKKK